MIKIKWDTGGNGDVYVSSGKMGEFGNRELNP